MSGVHPEVSLRKVKPADLDIYFQQQNDPDAVWTAAFTPPDPSDREAFDEHWRTVLSDRTAVARTVIVDGKVAGHVLKLEHSLGPEVSYWLGREYWGKGIATEAVKQFLKTLKMRPVYARVSKDNVASLRVLQKCGFVIESEGKSYAHARLSETDWLLLSLSVNH